MLRMSWSGSTERASLFVGALITVCLGVALVQSSLLLLLAAATSQAPAGASAVAAMRFAESRLVTVTVVSVSLGLAAFLAVFVIGSTFAFTVAQRRRDLALLRLVGAAPHQVRRLLVGEAVLLGAVGAAVGAPVGLLAQQVQTRLLVRLGFVPAGFSAQWRPWVLGVSLLVGIGLAVGGVLVAARRASRVEPLEALRGTGEATRVMTRGRWVAGLVLAGIAAALVATSAVGGAAGGQAMAMCVSVCAAVAFTALSPLLVPGVARLLPVRLLGVLGELARADLRDGVRRSASTAAPLIVLVGLLLGQSGALTSYAAAGEGELRAGTVADLVVESTGPAAAGATSVPGVAAASTEVEVPVEVTTGTGDAAFAEIARALVVDPAAYVEVHPDSAAVADLRPGSVAAGAGALGVDVGDGVGVRVGEESLGRLPVVAAVPAAIGGGAALLLPPGLLPASALADAPVRTFVQLDAGADAGRVAQELAALGTVVSLDAWIERNAEAGSATNTAVLVVVMGLGGLYALIGVVNAVVIAAGERRGEFAVARATGLKRSQVVLMALVEAWAVAAIGLLLGGLAAAGTFLAVLITTAAVTGTATLALPWLLIAAVVAGALLVTGATSTATSLAATRPSPVTLLRARAS